MHPSIHCRVIYNSQDLEATQVSINVDYWINKKWYLYTIEYYFAVKKNEIFPFAIRWMDLEGIMLSKIRQRKTNNIWCPSYVPSKDQNKKADKTETDSDTENKQRCVR